ncbi:hypothetical protein KAJ27_02165, partial [bacterium]|nr:hypothetical protein [bacterium]
MIIIKRCFLLLLLFTVSISYLSAQHYEQERAPLRAIITDGAYTLHQGEFVSKTQLFIQRFSMNMDPTPTTPFSGDEFNYLFKLSETHGKYIYGIRDWWQVELSTRWEDRNTMSLLPASYQTMIHDSGFSSPTLKFRHRFASNDSFSDIGITYGVKFESPSRKAAYDYLFYDSNNLDINGNQIQYKVAPFQFGGTDFMFGFNFASELEPGLLVGDIEYNWTREFTNRFNELENPGNFIKYNLGMVYPVGNYLRLVGEINASHYYVNRIEGVKQEQTDHHHIFLSPGLQLCFGDSFIAEASYMIPLKN